jgi:hypothetical protein
LNSCFGRQNRCRRHNPSRELELLTKTVIAQERELVSLQTLQARQGIRWVAARALREHVDRPGQRGLGRDHRRGELADRLAAFFQRWRWES